MAKIENTSVYPTVTPAADDLLIATDVSNENRTVTFLVSDITSGGALQGLQSVLDTGNTATQTITLTGNITVLGAAGTGYISACQYYAGGTAGAVGQVLTSQGNGACATWETPAAVTCCNLNDTLTVGNSTSLNIDTTGSINMTGAASVLALSGGTAATISGTGSNLTMGANSDIFLGNTSELNFGATAKINDYSGATGAAGQILVVNAAGTGVEWSTGVPSASVPTLQQVLTAGNTATGLGIAFSGPSTTTFDTTATISSSADNAWLGTNTFSANGTSSTTAGVALTGSLWDGASTGVVDYVLKSTNTGVEWVALSTLGVTSVTQVAATTSTGNPLTISPITGSVLVTQHIYDGGANLGVVPSGGTASTFLRGDGTWQTPTSAVTSVSAGAPGTSTGTPLTITPTTGAVVATSNAYAGTTNIGHVPAGGTASTFLRGDGTWVTPTSSGLPTETVRVDINLNKASVTAGNYMHYYTHNSASWGAAFNGTHQAIDPAGLAASPQTTPAGVTNDIHTAGIVVGNPGYGSVCTASYPNMKLCAGTLMMMVDTGGTFTFNLWKTSICTGGTSYVKAYECSLEITDETSINCCGAPTIATTGAEVLAAGEGYFLTVQSAGTIASIDMQATMYLRFVHTT